LPNIWPKQIFGKSCQKRKKYYFTFVENPIFSWFSFCKTSFCSLYWWALNVSFPVTDMKCSANRFARWVSWHACFDLKRFLWGLPNICLGLFLATLSIFHNFTLFLAIMGIYFLHRVGPGTTDLLLLLVPLFLTVSEFSAVATMSVIFTI
jgi:hypothetical protein